MCFGVERSMLAPFSYQIRVPSMFASTFSYAGHFGVFWMLLAWFELEAVFECPRLKSKVRLSKKSSRSSVWKAEFRHCYFKCLYLELQRLDRGNSSWR